MTLRKLFLSILVTLLSLNLCSADTSYIGNYEGATVLEEKTYEFIEFPMIVGLKPYEGRSTSLFKSEVKIGHFNSRSLAINKNIDSVRVYYNYQKKLEELGYKITIAVSSTTAHEKYRLHSLSHEIDTLSHKLITIARHEERNMPFVDSYNSRYDPLFFIAAEKITKHQESYVNFYMSTDPHKASTTNRMAIAVLEKALITEDEIDTFKPEFLSATDIKRSIDKDGKAALYNIYFDFDKATLKKESEPAIAEIAKYLRENPNEKLIVTGHTDNVGDFGYNVELSKKRSFAVLGRLIKGYGIDAKRLLGFGAGMAAPVATNDTEAGRTQNRRVELVRWNSHTPSVPTSQVLN